MDISIQIKFSHINPPMLNIITLSDGQNNFNYYCNLLPARMPLINQALMMLYYIIINKTIF